MDYENLFGQLLFPASLVIAFVFLWRSSRRQRAVLTVGLENTKAVQENTAAVRDLIAKLDERAP